MAYPVPLSHHAEHFGWRGNRGPNDSPVHEDDRVTYSVPSTERLLNAKHFSRLPPKSVARQWALWQDTLREGSVRALCQGREYNSSGLTCHLKEAVRARNSIERSVTCWVRRWRLCFGSEGSIPRISWFQLGLCCNALLASRTSLQQRPQWETRSYVT